MLKASPAPEVRYRLLEAGDSFLELNSLLAAAYQRLFEQGLHFAATRENPEQTREAARNCEIHLAVSADGRLVGCVMLRLPGTDTAPEYCTQPHLTSFGRFGVHPDWKGQGIGGALLERIENRAREWGLTELTLNTAEPATHLREFYAKRGYTFVAHHQWDKTNYRSVVLSKRL